MNRRNDITAYATKVGEEKHEWDTQIDDVYEIGIEHLCFNYENGRIATRISSYKEMHTIEELLNLPKDEYNDKIQEFLERSNSQKANEETMEDIRRKGQNRTAVILSNGIVVSGNRRFMCLRKLYAETSDEKFRNFRCFIINKDQHNENDREFIKYIEMSTQFSVNEKTDYEPIQRLVEICNNVILPGAIWTPDQYTKKFKISKTDFQLLMNKAKVMLDYLDFVNQNKKYYFAEENKLDGPLQEVARLYGSMETQEWNRIKPALYFYFDKRGDKSRDIRSIVKLYKHDKATFEKFLNQCMEDTCKKEMSFLSSFKNNKKLNEKNNNKNFFYSSSATNNENDLITSELLFKGEINVKKQESINKIEKDFKKVIATLQKICEKSYDEKTKDIIVQTIVDSLNRIEEIKKRIKNEFE